MKTNKEEEIKPPGEMPEWYSAKCIFRHDNLSDEEDTTVYEERIVLLRAHNLDEAIEFGEREAKEYAHAISEVEYIGFIAVYRLFDKRMRHNAEVYSIMRVSKLSEEQFVDRYYDDGTERTLTSDSI